MRCDLAIDSHLLVTGYDKTNPTGLDYVNAGVMGLKREVLAAIMPGQPVSLETDVFPRLIERRQVRAHITDQRFYDIGSLSGLDSFEQLLSGGAA
jgi:NDP-sugar pyrophosphorylase family protein